MAWSTNQLAELAGTTLKAVRHYHKIGLLEEPERAANGYKRYRIGHLLRLLRIRRLVDLGVPLADIAAMQESDETAERTLRALDAELAASIERQQRMREDLAAILENRVLAELPPGFADLAGDLPDADRAILLAYSSFLTPSAMATLRELHSVPRTATMTEFDTLAEDTPEEVRQRLAERFAPEVRRQQEEYPFLSDLEVMSRRGKAVAESVVVQSLLEFYNPAQLDVLRRVNALIAETPQCL
ncbi:MerR family transcriptional regulator [Amycolatopsis sp. YIM 10]|uniref:MerR family transcriptional regulator n=1 Tax=Amycolatopsis sp. YIM 10 TaxID=2653857 RepID=UPI00129065BE|nr:MerR family transcriptional regulator [Amycolatopsis sp. YIM 10]QFU87187.1 HTH-type transcriptional activator TipA [Amycolatopsis sp. YIM 10]